VSTVDSAIMAARPGWHGRRGSDYAQLSARVRGSRLVDLTLVDLTVGGFNYQIERHLLPGMICGSVRRAEPIVGERWRRHGPPYVQTVPVGSFRRAVHHLHSDGRAEQPVRP
jgi:fatty acid desaturase